MVAMKIFTLDRGKSTGSVYINESSQGVGVRNRVELLFRNKHWRVGGAINFTEFQ